MQGTTLGGEALTRNPRTNVNSVRQESEPVEVVEFHEEI